MAEEVKGTGLGGIRPMIMVVAFLVVRTVLTGWLIRPLAVGVALLLVFLLAYFLEEPRVTLARWASFTLLLSVLVPGVVYGVPYLLCGRSVGFAVYGIAVSLLTLAMRYIWAGFFGELTGSSRGWALISVAGGVLAALWFYLSPETFCRGDLWRAG